MPTSVTTFSPSYVVDWSKVGDTTAEALRKHIKEFEAAYSCINNVCARADANTALNAAQEDRLDLLADLANSTESALADTAAALATLQAAYDNGSGQTLSDTQALWTALTTAQANITANQAAITAAQTAITTNQNAITANQTAIANLTNNSGVVYVNYSNVSVTLASNQSLYYFGLNDATKATVSAAPLTRWPKTAGASPAYVGNFIQLFSGSDQFTYKLKENMLNGQVHLWRVACTYTKAASNTSDLTAQLVNDDSGFRVLSSMILPSGATSGNASFNLFSVADSNSLATGKGYRLGMGSTGTDATCTVTLKSIARVSFAIDLH